MRKKLIEVALPLDAINAASAKEKSIRHGHPSTLHLWWARRPLAACRAVLFGQLVDDPSSWPELFPTEEEQDRERQRLFDIIEAMVPWKASGDENIINAARLEIARSVARNRRADGEGTDRDDHVLAEAVTPEVVNAYLAEVAPPVHDPFAGGGSIPLEAQRLGLRAIASDLNPVAVLINKALIEIPPKFAGMPPVNPEWQEKSDQEKALRTWKGAEGLAEDVRYYGKWMRDEAFKRIGHLYPPVKVTEQMAEGRPDLEPYVGHELTVIAWLWARTVASPNPAMGGAHVPLVSSFWLSKKKGKETWVEPVVDHAAGTWRFEVRTGKPDDPKAVVAGTKTGRGDFRCILSGDPIPAAYVRAQGQEGHIRDRLMAVVLEGERRRVYLPAGSGHEDIARVPIPDGVADTGLPARALGFRVQNYGMRKHRDLFTPRQLTALDLFAALVRDVSAQVMRHAHQAESAGLEYAEDVAVLLGMAVSRRADRWTSLSIWDTTRDTIVSLIRLSAIPMTWEYAEANPFSSSTGNMIDGVKLTSKNLEALYCGAGGVAQTRDAARPLSIVPRSVVATDPPYFDNVPYADLSDFFYVWQRRALSELLPEVFETMLVPKATELVADPFRHGGRKEAEEFFLSGVAKVLSNLAAGAREDVPAVVFYAFKQAEARAEGVSSTGWDVFLSAAIGAGFMTTGTWPVRTEQGGGLRVVGRNSLASSVVLVCRKRPDNAPSIDRGTFRRTLSRELPAALRQLQKSNIAPVDMAQASIGPGMAIFSRHARVLEADGSAMSVRTALQLINEALDAYLAEQAGEMDADTSFAVTWFETHTLEAGPYGEAETLAKARNVSVQGIVEAGIIHAGAGKVRLLGRAELPEDWEPETDTRLTIWECTQHLIRRLEERGEQAAADLLARLGDRAEPARDLAYRLYQTCERKGWAEDARAYNTLVVAWPELSKLAARSRASGAVQGELF